jgi:hypothetical protein
MRKSKVTTCTCLLVLIAYTFADFTIGVIPDTQRLSETNSGGELIKAMNRFFVDRKDELNVVFVAALGDMTENSYNSEWTRVKAAYDVYLPAGIPFAPCHGNHDDISDINAWFPVSDFENTPAWGGSRNGGIENAYYLFSVEGMNFVLVMIEYTPSNNDINWANDIFEQYEDRRGIVASHDIWASNIESDVIKQNDNIFMSVQGHRTGFDDGEHHWTTTSPCGHTQHQILTDYQARPNKGAIIRYYTFKPAEDKIYAFTYNITEEAYEVDNTSQFSFDYDMEIPTAMRPHTHKYTMNSHKILSVPALMNGNIIIKVSPCAGPITINAYDISGRIIKRLYNGNVAAAYNLTVRSNDLPSGMVYLKVNGKSVSEVREFVNMK